MHSSTREQARARIERHLERNRRRSEMFERRALPVRKPTAEELEEDLEMQLQNERAQRVMFPHLRMATLEEYGVWLKGYLSKGNNVTHVYDYPLRLDKFYVATGTFQLVGLYGASSISIIIPHGIEVTLDSQAGFRGLGHNHLYFMENYEVGGDFVPLYSNIKVDPQEITCPFPLVS